MPVKEMFGEDRKPGFEVLHSNYLLHIDAEGRVVGKYIGTNDAEVASLRRALQGDVSNVPQANSKTEATPETKAK